MSSALKTFETVFPKIIADLSQHAQQYGLPENALKWYEDVSPPPRLVPPSWLIPADPVAQIQHHGRKMQSRHVGRRHHPDPPRPVFVGR